MRLRVLVLLATCVLAACSKPRELLPEEVLLRAALAGQKLASARFDVDLDGVYTDAKGSGEVGMTFGASGIFSNNGDAVTADVDLSVVRQEQTASTLAFNGSVTALADGETYIKVNALEGNMLEEASPFAGMEHVIGTWMRFPSTHNNRSVRLTPDPKILKAQAAVVRVTDNLGLIKDGETYVYHYRVEIDPQQLRETVKGANHDDLADISAAGELWIDAHEFYIKRALWNITDLPVFEGKTTAQVNIRLEDHDSAPAISIPATATLIDPLSFALPQVTLLMRTLREADGISRDTL